MLCEHAECAFEVVYACIWSSDPVTIPSSSQHHSWSSIKVQWRGEIATLTDKGVGVGGCVTWVGGGRWVGEEVRTGQA